MIDSILVRAATRKDCDLCVGMSRLLHEVTGYGDLMYNLELAKSGFDHYLNNQDAGLWVLEVNGECAGVIMALFCQVSLSSYEKAVVEKGFFILPKYRGLGLLKYLLNALEEWALEKESKYIYTSASTQVNQDDIVRKLGKFGYHHFSTILRKTIF